MAAPLPAADGIVPDSSMRPARLQRSAWMKRAGMLIGGVLLGAAVFAVCRQHATLTQALDALGRLAPAERAFWLALLAGTVVANVVLSGTLFSLLISRYGRVGWLEMQALIAAGTLMNYLPLRPGLFGRLAYHKTCHGIPLADSVKTVVQGVLLSAVAASFLMACIFLAPQTRVNLWWIALAPLPLLLAGGWAVRRYRIWTWAVLVRYLEVLILAVRYHAAFALIGSPIGSRGALAFACISVIAVMVPFLSNGLGLREWAIGLAAPLLTPYQMELGMTADLLNRAAELAIVLILGLAGAAWIAAQRRNWSRRAIIK